MSLTDKNLYAYCDNNPVMRVDGDGEFWNYIIGGVVGAIVGGFVAAVNGGDITDVLIGIASGSLSGVVAASPLSWIAQAGISSAISAGADIANQVVDIVQSGGNIGDYNIMQTITEAGLGFVTSAIGSGLGKVADAKIFKNISKSNSLYDKYLGKTFSAGLRKESGRSSSALIRQAGRYLSKSNYYQNCMYGISSVIGSGISLWNVAR